MSKLGQARETDRPRVVYRCFDGDLCLYVGQTVNLQARMSSHVATTPWAQGVTRVETSAHRDLAEARVVESGEIERLRPRWNIDGRPPRAEWSPCDYVEVIDALRHKGDERYHPGRRKIDVLRDELQRRYPEIAVLPLPHLTDMLPRRQRYAS